MGNTVSYEAAPGSMMAMMSAQHFESEIFPVMSTFILRASALSPAQSSFMCSPMFNQLID
jgi:hypothetical protein